MMRRPPFEVVLFGGAMLFGYVYLSLAKPTPLTADDCKVFKVDQKAVTSYVLKPPPAPPPEHPVCPVVPVPKCEPVVQSEPEANPAEEPKRRHHRRHRRYWR